jgi:hypothetical protein
MNFGYWVSSQLRDKQGLRFVVRLARLTILSRVAKGLGFGGDRAQSVDVFVDTADAELA